MPAFAGSVAASAIYAAASGLVGGAFDTRTESHYPYTGSGYLGGPAANGAVTKNLPLAFTHQAKGGNVAGNFAMSDWYNKVHITPALIQLGNLVSGTTKTVRVWNGWLDRTETLNTVMGVNADGITLNGPSNPPITFQPNQELAWIANVSTNGPPIISATFTYTFADGEKVAVAFTGQRITAWSLVPDWANGIAERLEFKTDVLKAWSGAEQRRALRIAPRRTFTFDVQMKDAERRFIEAVLFNWSARVFALPIWPDGQRLGAQLAAGAVTLPCDTVNRDFVAGGLAILITDAITYEVVQVTGVSPTSLALTNPVQNTWSKGTRLFPARAARLAGYPKITRENGMFATAKPSFLVVDACDWPAATGLPSYRTLPVLENAPNEGALEMTLARKTVTIDGDTGVIAVDDLANAGLPLQTHDWFMQGRTARTNFRALLYLLRGRQGEIWVPTYQMDLKMVAPMTDVQLLMNVEFTGYTQYLAGSTNRQDIRVELKNGQVFYRRIGASTVVDPQTERLTLDQSFGRAVQPSDIRRISYMAVCRLNSDAIEITHHTAIDGLATSSTPWQALNRSM